MTFEEYKIQLKLEITQRLFEMQKDIYEHIDALEDDHCYRDEIYTRYAAKQFIMNYDIP